MCKICGDAGHKASIVDEVLSDMSENAVVALHRLAAQRSGDNPVETSALVAAVVLIGVLDVEGLPVPAIERTEQGGLGMDFRSSNRIVEVEVFPDGRSFEFVVAQIEGEDEENLQLVCQMGLFTYDDVCAASDDDRGPGALADWLVGGEFAESLDRYVYTEDSEDTCLISEPGSEPTNIADHN